MVEVEAAIIKASSSTIPEHKTLKTALALKGLTSTYLVAAQKPDKSWMSESPNKERSTKVYLKALS